MNTAGVWRFIGDSLCNGTPVMLMMVVESRGSSPGRAGFKMAVTADGRRDGTIGGGIMEMNWVEHSRTVLREQRTAPLVQELYHSRETKHMPSGLICSGSQTLLLKPLYSSDATVVQQINRLFERHESARLHIAPRVFALSETTDGNDVSFTFASSEEWVYEENIGVLDTLVIAGSGHVGLALSRLAATLDFRVLVIDDRPDAPTFVANTFAHQKIHTSYERVGEYLRGNGRDYVAIVTTGYKSDEAVLKSILKKNVKYIGLMGSPAKTQQIFDDLRNEGFREEELERIRTPIGMPIASHTPAEIAVSIAAEIIQLKNQSSDNEH